MDKKKLYYWTRLRCYGLSTPREEERERERERGRERERVRERERQIAESRAER